MSLSDYTSPLILLSLILLFTAGILNLFFGKKLPRLGLSGVSLGLLIAIVSLSFSFYELAQTQFQIKSWLRGWIWPKEEMGAITAGLLEDPVGLIMAGLALLVGVFSLLSKSLDDTKLKPERFSAGVALGGAGAALAWISLTPWLSFLGLLVTNFAAFVAFSARWDSKEDSNFSARFAWQRIWGLLFCLLGTAGIASGKAALSWGLSAESSALGVVSFQNQLGGWLLLVGLLIQCEVFPFFSWLLMPSETFPVARAVLGQILPGMAAFAILYRVSPWLSQLGIFPLAGWIALGSLPLVALSGLMQAQWKESLRTLVSLGLIFSFAALSLEGRWISLGIFIAVNLSSAALSIWLTALEVGGPSGNANRKKAITCKAFMLVSLLGFFGALGFVSAGGMARWFVDAWSVPAVFAALAAGVLMINLLGWKLFWAATRLKLHTQASWFAVLSPVILFLLTLGILWNGSLTGALLDFPAEKVLPSTLDLMTGKAEEVLSPEGISFWLQSGLLGLSFLLSLIFSKRIEDRWISLAKRLPRFAGFVAEGYGMDRLTLMVEKTLARVGGMTYWLVDQKIWNHFLPFGITGGIRWGAKLSVAGDKKVVSFFARFLRIWIDVPSKMLQLVQNGDVQWYIFFGLGSGLAMLIHFLRI